MSAQHSPGLWEALPPAKTGRHWSVGSRGVMDGKPCLWIIARIDNGRPGDTLETEAHNARALGDAIAKTEGGPPS